MAEVEAVRDETKPHETLLVVDGLTGQDAVNVAEQFDGRVGISGVILTRMDGDGRGGAALSMRAVTGKPIRFVGLGEKLDALEDYARSRPLAWIDDSLDESCFEWADERSAPTLLVPTESEVGLLDAHVEALEAWARDSFEPG